MRRNRLVLLLALVLVFGCKKETETLQWEALSDYLPTQTGKYITYRVDSTVLTNFGTTTEIRSYQEKHQVDALTTDNLGRPSYRVFRFTRDTAGTQPWKPSGSYFITPNGNTIEVIENNLRYVKLTAPIKADYSWKGNRFLPTEPYKDLYQFSNDDDPGMPDWDYTYTDVNGSVSYKGQPLGNVLVIQQVNESINAPVTQPQAYGYINYSVEKYAKGIGLVFQELTMWEYQPNTGGGNGYKNGFGVKRSMIDHN